MLSFSLAALITIAASIVAAILDAAIKDEKAFLPLLIQRWLRKGLSDKQRAKKRRWRRIFDRLILNLADQQLVTGFALLICGYLFTQQGALHLSAHWNLVVYLSCLSSSTHLACVITLRKHFEQHRRAGILRLIFIILFALLLVPAIVLTPTFRIFLIPFSVKLSRAYEVNNAALAIDGTLKAFVLLYVFFSAVMQLLSDTQDHLKAWITNSLLPSARQWLGISHLSSLFQRFFGQKSLRWAEYVQGPIASILWYFVFLTPCTVFCAQIVFGIVAFAYSFTQKFMQPTSTDRNYYKLHQHMICSLNLTAENNWSFGQLLSMILLLLPFLSAWEAYYGKVKAFFCSLHAFENVSLV